MNYPNNENQTKLITCGCNCNCNCGCNEMQCRCNDGSQTEQSICEYNNCTCTSNNSCGG